MTQFTVSLADGRTEEFMAFQCSRVRDTLVFYGQGASFRAFPAASVICWESEGVPHFPGNHHKLPVIPMPEVQIFSPVQPAM